MFALSYVGIAISPWLKIVAHHYETCRAAFSPMQAFVLIAFAAGAVVKMLVPWPWFDDKIRAAWHWTWSQIR